MRLSEKIERYLSDQQISTRSTEQVYALLAQELGDRYVEAVKRLLVQRTNESISTDAFYDIVARLNIQKVPLYDIFASRARKAIIWNLEKICAEISITNGSILDAGCGTGLTSCFLGMTYSEANIEGIDISEGMTEAAKKRADSLKLTNVKFFKQNYQEHRGRQYDLIACVHTLDESCNTQTDESLRIYHLQNLLTEGGKLVLIRAGMHKKEGFDYEGETCNLGHIRESFLLGIPPEIIFQFNDADGEGMQQGLTVWGKEKDKN